MSTFFRAAVTCDQARLRPYLYDTTRAFAELQARDTDLDAHVASVCGTTTPPHIPHEPLVRARSSSPGSASPSPGGNNAGASAAELVVKQRQSERLLTRTFTSTVPPFRVVSADVYLPPIAVASDVISRRATTSTLVVRRDAAAKGPAPAAPQVDATAAPSSPQPSRRLSSHSTASDESSTIGAVSVVSIAGSASNSEEHASVHHRNDEHYAAAQPLLRRPLSDSRQRCLDLFSRTRDFAHDVAERTARAIHEGHVDAAELDHNKNVFLSDAAAVQLTLPRAVTDEAAAVAAGPDAWREYAASRGGARKGRAPAHARQQGASDDDVMAGATASHHHLQHRHAVYEQCAGRAREKLSRLIDGGAAVVREELVHRLMWREIQQRTMRARVVANNNNT